MAEGENGTTATLPEEMIFSILKSPALTADASQARLGRLLVPGRKSIQTPHFIANTSRGVVPHLAHDLMRRHTDISGVYVALEDFIEKSPRETPPLLNFAASMSAHEPSASALRAFIALQEEALLVLGPRRVPPIPCPGSNSDDGVAILTSVGFKTLSATDYANATSSLRPDIVVGMADLVADGVRSSWKRVDKMGYRTEKWMCEMVEAVNGEDKPEGENDDNGGDGIDAMPRHTTSSNPKPLIFAPILPIDLGKQSLYLSTLSSPPSSDGLLPHISGLTLATPSVIPLLPTTLSHLPRLALCAPQTPHDLLHQIALGVDVCMVPFLTTATDAGIALTFEFPAPSSLSSSEESKLPLGTDLWAASPPPSSFSNTTTTSPDPSSQPQPPPHATSPFPLSPTCTCHTCTTYSTAYLHHLLHAREMLAWTLLQLHNHAQLSRFFAGVRASLAATGPIDTAVAGEDTTAFDHETRRFRAVYAADLPMGLGSANALGPRRRGYQVTGERAGGSGTGGAGGMVEGGMSGRINKRVFGRLDGIASAAAATAAAVAGGAEGGRGDKGGGGKGRRGAGGDGGGGGNGNRDAAAAG
ncbi:MAG: hypothetical protein M1819_002946 [Sarea resinae]|nr:MAG: hypothetical protein M1819_002946 [Sarea resinae]